MRALRLVLMGCGRVARKHLEATAQSQGRWEVVGIVEPKPEHIPLSWRHLPHALSPQALLAQGCPKFDGVVVASPSGHHVAHALWAIAQGARVVIVEKPLALTVADAINVVEAAQKAGVRLWCCYPMRLYPTLKWLKKTLEQGGLGDLHTCEAHIYWTRPQAYFDQAPWRGTRELDGGLWLNQANHMLEALAWLCGVPSEVWAQEARPWRAIEVGDVAVAMGRWAGGMMGTVTATVLTWPRNLETSLTLLGSKGSVRLEGPCLGKVAYWEGEDQVWVDQVRQGLLQESNDLVAAHGYAPSYALWWESLAADRPQPDPGGLAHWVALARWCESLGRASQAPGHEVR